MPVTWLQVHHTEQEMSSRDDFQDCHPLTYFCRLHSKQSDPLYGPRGMISSLISQLAHGGSLVWGFTAGWASYRDGRYLPYDTARISNAHDGRPAISTAMKGYEG
ncbi:hypothetical protein BO94DRAFT_598978 [Aspergillus sclerotioniger CBS 115572]|uniref:Uncharacterized protein n=1 Tax=Aspergillus sclerotioniger CBS 115572 TaxID=1450535 RepID=A0A317WES3_9EURO|nr:hypothetical protein BO94DRAFT_598978 [Aspergillus sclerotioniger CBS 115572]PWY83727.1 hypothetical protein BO94DRAFT_598978 [Aspergillus sclerotioniger CBS 115572]